MFDTQPGHQVDCPICGQPVLCESPEKAQERSWTLSLIEKFVRRPAARV